MEIVVKKVSENGTEYLPNTSKTDIEYLKSKCYLEQEYNVLTSIYDAIFDKEMFYQYNNISVANDIQYSFYCGVLAGKLKAYGLTERSDIDKYVIVDASGNVILIVDRLQLPNTFKTSQTSMEEVYKIINGA